MRSFSFSLATGSPPSQHSPELGLSRSPRILADEPTGNLDSKSGLAVMELLAQLNAEGTTIVMVTHSQHDAQMASRIINLLDGQVVDNNNIL